MGESERARPLEGAGQELIADQSAGSTCTLDRRDGDDYVESVDTFPSEGRVMRIIWHRIGGFRFGSVEVEYSGPWYCREKHRWDGAEHGPMCPTCGGEGRANRPPPPPLPDPRPRDEVLKQLRGLVRYLRESPKQEPADRLRWVTPKIAWMLAVGELVDLRSAIHALRDDAEAAGVSRAEAEAIIQAECETTWGRRPA